MANPRQAALGSSGFHHHRFVAIDAARVRVDRPREKLDYAIPLFPRRSNAFAADGSEWDRREPGAGPWRGWRWRCQPGSFASADHFEAGRA